MIVSSAAGRRRISSLLCRQQPAPSLLFGRGCPRPRPCRHCHGQRRGPVDEHEAVAENQLVLQAASGHHRRLGGKARWWPDEAVRSAAHPVMRVVRPPRRRRAVALSVLLCPSPSASSLALSAFLRCRVIALSSLLLVLITFSHHRPCLRHCGSCCCCHQCHC